MAREYKDSGIEWIGQIPKEWKMTRGKFLFSVLNGYAFDSSLFTNDTNMMPLIRIRDINSSETEAYYMGEYPSDYIVHKDDVLVGMDGDFNVAKWKGNDALLNQRVCKLKEFSETYISQYAYYILPMLLKYKNDVTYATTVKHLSSNDILNFDFIVPSLSEQQKIADYLDKVCGEVDEMVALQETMIEELKAYKQSVITEAVTKGLNPNVPMRDSGIDWIGEIPEHWETGKTLYVLSMPITDGPHTTPDLFDDGVPFISADAVSDSYINFDNKRGFVSKEFYDECCKKYIPQLYDVYMIKSGASTGRTAIVETQEIFTIWSPLAVFRANPEVMTPYYLLYMLRSDGYQKQVETFWSYGTQQNIGMRTLEKLIVCIPPLSEQRAIASYLDTKCSEIDSLIALKQAKIEELKEYKKSVIYEYVTGKKEVV